MSQKVIVIGAGMGGLAAALRLRKLGFGVQLLEKGPFVGGRANVIEENGFRVDTGPTILVMKDTLAETYHSIGYDIEERLDLVQLDPNYRLYYHDGTHLDLYSQMPKLAQAVEAIQPGAGERMFRFLGDGAKKYELGIKYINRNFESFIEFINPKTVVDLLQIGTHRNLYRLVARYFNGNDKLTKAFSFQTMFLGLSPFDAMALYSLITYADLGLGMWYPRGGFYAIVEDMVKIADEMGIEIRTNAPVEEILAQAGEVRGVRLQNGEELSADIVVSNADLPYTYQSLVPPAYCGAYHAGRIKRMKYACSGFLLYLGVDRTYDHVQHQSIYFSEGYKANLDAIFKTKTIPEEPSFHMNIPTVTDPGLAPDGHSLIYLLAPMPNTTAQIDWERSGRQVREKLLDVLEELIDPAIRRHIVWERQYCPDEYTRDFNAVHGTAFGSLAQGFFQSSYFRPPNKAASMGGLYFVGQATSPGIGIPMVHTSARLVAERIANDWL